MVAIADVYQLDSERENDSSLSNLPAKYLCNVQISQPKLEYHHRQSAASGGGLAHRNSTSLKFESFDFSQYLFGKKTVLGRSLFLQ